MSTPSTARSLSITGGDRGIGFETARQLGAVGIPPVIGARSAETGRDAAAQLREEGIEAESIGCDVTNDADHRRAFDFFRKKAGLPDILINNAGVYLEGESGDA